MLVNRDISEQVRQRARKNPVVSITGPRQSGKTTLAKMLFPDYAHLSLERLDYREQALADTKINTEKTDALSAGPLCLNSY